jgi:hypothetical protein
MAAVMSVTDFCRISTVARRNLYPILLQSSRCAVTKSPGHLIGTACLRVLVEGEHRQYELPLVLKALIVSGKPFRIRDVGNVQLDVTIRGEEKRGGPLLGFVENLARLAEGPALNDLLCWAYQGAESNYHQQDASE